MLRRDFQPNNFDPHRDEGILLAYRDGELPPKKAQAVKRHLAQCWDCSTRLRELEEAIAWLLVAEPPPEEYETPPMVMALNELRGRMVRLREDFSWSHARWCWRHGWAMAWILVFGALVSIGSLLYLSRTAIEPKVSAAEIIHRIREAERVRLFTPNKIIHQRLRYEQKKALPQMPLPNGTYWIERWWDNTSTPRRMVYRMRDVTGRLVSGTWIFADGASVRYEQYTTSGQPQVLYGPSFKTIRRYIQRFPARRRADLESLLSLAEQNLEVYEQTSLTRWQRFLEEIRTGQVKGHVQRSRINSQPVYILTVDRVDDTRGPYRWVATVSSPDFRVLEASVFAPPSRGTYEMKWTEIEFETIPPEQVDPGVFSLDSLPEKAAHRSLTIAEGIQQLEDNAKRWLPHKK